MQEMNGPHIRQTTPQDAERLGDGQRIAGRENRELGIPAKEETATMDGTHEWLYGSRLCVAESGGQDSSAVRIEEVASERLNFSRLGVRDE